MSTVITAVTSEETTEPAAVEGYATDRRSQNIIHTLISGGIAVALIAPNPRSGVLRLTYVTEADAFAALALHSIEDTFTIENEIIPSLNMTYVIDGTVSLSLDEATRAFWVLSVGYQEVET